MDRFDAMRGAGAGVAKVAKSLFALASGHTDPPKARGACQGVYGLVTSAAAPTAWRTLGTVCCNWIARYRSGSIGS
jgi:hypothetical protein